MEGGGIIPSIWDWSGHEREGVWERLRASPLSFLQSEYWGEKEEEACQAGEGCQSSGWPWLLGPLSRSHSLLLCLSSPAPPSKSLHVTRTHRDKKRSKTDGCQFSDSEWKGRRVPRQAKRWGKIPAVSVEESYVYTHVHTHSLTQETLWNIPTTSPLPKSLL